MARDLDDDGAPLLFDSMHPCGCYHWFFPTGRLALKPPLTSVKSSAGPQTLPRIAAATPIALRVETGTLICVASL